MRRDLAQAPGRVILTGFIPPPDMPRAYLLGDVFVGPSQIEEGLGLVFLEAAAAGLPIIATRKGGIPEVVRDDFNGLLLRQPDDAAELAEKITGLLNDAPLRQRLGQQGRDWVRADFSWEKIARTLEEFYDEVMEQGSGPGIQGLQWFGKCRVRPAHHLGRFQAALAGIDSLLEAGCTGRISAATGRSYGKNS